MIKTKLAQRLFGEFANKLHLEGDHAMLLAAGVDNGTMRAPQARMIAGLSSDWGMAALQDATTSLAEINTGTKADRAQQTADRSTVSAIMSMAQQQNMTADETRDALMSGVGAGYENALTREHKAFLNA